MGVTNETSVNGMVFSNDSSNALGVSNEGSASEMDVSQGSSRSSRSRSSVNSSREESSANGSRSYSRSELEEESQASNQTGGWSNSNGSTTIKTTTYNHLDALMVPFLVCLCPGFAMVVVYTIMELQGQIAFLIEDAMKGGIVSLLTKAWLPYAYGSEYAWKVIIVFCMFELLLMKILPGRLTQGPVTPAGNIPVYKANGLLAFFVTMATFFMAAHFELFYPEEIYNHYLEIIGALVMASFLFCFFLYLKGLIWPSSTDSGYSGNFFFDFYWGTELYPRIFNWDVKQFTNCRFGMMAWPLLIVCYAWKQYETEKLSDSMLVAVVLQLIYVAKFFHWEMGYMKTLDIMHDRAGFYLVSMHVTACVF